jgi:hypothetical protein
MKKYLLVAVALVALGVTAANAACFTYGNLYRCENPDFSQSYGERYGNITRQWGTPPGGYNNPTPSYSNQRGGHPAPTMRQWQN